MYCNKLNLITFHVYVQKYTFEQRRVCMVQETKQRVKNRGALRICTHVLLAFGAVPLSSHVGRLLLRSCSEPVASSDEGLHGERRHSKLQTQKDAGAATNPNSVPPHPGFAGLPWASSRPVQRHSPVFPRSLEQILHHFIGALLLGRPDDLLPTALWPSREKPAGEGIESVRNSYTTRAKQHHHLDRGTKSRVWCLFILRCNGSMAVPGTWALKMKSHLTERCYTRNVWI